MYVYELLPRLKYLTLVGKDDEGNLEFLGNEAQWHLVKTMELEVYGD